MTLLNSLSHFDICFNYDSGSYEFQTESGIRYSVSFLEYAHVMAVDFPVYSLIIERHIPKGIRKKSSGDMVRNTIACIFDLFFAYNQSALISIYDSLDGKQTCRKRLFDYWFSTLNDGKLRKEEGAFMLEDSHTYAVAIFPADHAHSETIIAKFKDLLELNFYNE